MHKKAELVQRRLRELGAVGAVREFPDGTRTAVQAAEAIGTTVGQIAKSLVFTTTITATATAEPPGAPVRLLVVASGLNRVDLDKVAAVVGEPVRPLEAKLVKQVTGFAIGGVPPVAHATPLRVLVDRDLLDYPDVWAAAGTPNTVFPITPDELVRVTGGEVADVREEASQHQRSA